MKNVYINGQSLGKFSAKNFRDCIIESRKLLKESDYKEVFVTSHSISNTDFACKYMFPKELKSYQMFKGKGNNMRNVTLLDKKCDMESILSTVQESRASRDIHFHQGKNNKNDTNIKYFVIRFPEDESLSTFKQVTPNIESYEEEGEDEKEEVQGSKKKYLYLYNQHTWYISRR